MQITEAYIKEVSPDLASTKNANKLLQKTQWIVQRSRRAIWSEIYGSGKKPYLTQIDASNIAFKCSCPSRKFPCKHGLALGLYVAEKGAETLNVESEPLWVQEWIDKRESKATTPVKKPIKEKAPEVKKAEDEKRWSRASSDIQVLELWLEDVVKMGILDFPMKDEAYWEGLKRRMVDLKLSGLNTFFTRLQTESYQDGWEQVVLETLAEMHLLIQVVKGYRDLDDDFKQELGYLLGWGVSKQELLQSSETEVLDDKWIVVKVMLSENSGLTVRKVYLYGSETKRWSYILEFAHGNSYFDDHYVEGSILQAKLMFYGGVFKQRAYVKIKGGEQEASLSQLNPLEDLARANEQFQDAKMLFPWLFEYPQLVGGCNVVEQDSSFYLLDEQCFIVPLLDFSMERYFELISQSRGELFDAFFIRKREGVELLGFVQNEKVVSL